jgi:hypothetical protein
MPGLLVHVGAIINCFHPPGTVTANTTGPPRVLVNKGVQQVLTTKELHKVAGCPFQVPGTPKLQPCVTVRLEPATRVFVNGEPAVILTPAAMCYSVEQIPQGPPNSSPIQTRVIAA